jgi:hypothetical protein
VRFISYRTRTKVHSNKKGLKNHPNFFFHCWKHYQIQNRTCKRVCRTKI